MGTAAASVLQQGRQAFARQAWGAAHELLVAADGAADLDAEDLQRAGWAAFLAGRDDEAFALLERAFNEQLRRGDPEHAALSGFWLAFGLLQRGDWARASGWMGRSRGVIDEDQRDCVARGFLMIPDALQSLMGGQPDAAYATFSEVRAVAERFADPDLLCLGGFGQGQALIALDRIHDGIGVLDEVMVRISAGEASALVTGLVYCGVIAACMETFDTQRAREWTIALHHWCSRQPDLVPFRAQCLVHRAQIMQLSGAWLDALEELEHALDRFGAAGHPAAGDAFYEWAEVHRLRGEFEAAERAYEEASRFGRDTQPGLACLRLAQGQLDAARAGLRRALDETSERSRRPALLSATVDAALEASDIAGARVAADELHALALDRDVAALHAMAARAEGAVLLAEGDARAALAAARRAWSLWVQLGAPYEAARTRVVAGMACRSLGDEDAACMELGAAREQFDHLAAGPDATRVARLVGRASGAVPFGLSPREVEVLRLVATGITNRAIAGELFLSEKTVARHISNIFTKLGVSSRAAATSVAYQHQLE